MQPSLSAARQQHNNRHRDNEEHRNGSPHPPVLGHEKMLLDRRSQRNDPVARDKPRNHKERQGGNKNRLAAGLHAAERQREDNPAERRPRRCPKIPRREDKRWIELLQRVEDRQDHKRDKDIDRYKNKAEIGKQNLLRADAYKLEHAVNRAVCAKEAEERVSLEQQVDPAWQDDKEQPELFMLGFRQQVGRRIGDQERERGNEKGVPERAQRHF